MHKPAILLVMTIALPLGAADWPHWGHGIGRNMVNPNEKNMPTTRRAES